MRTAAAATTALLLLLACSSAAARPLLGGLLGGQLLRQPCPQGAAPAAIDVGGLKAVGTNGVIELSWQPVPCATSYAVLVDREDLPADKDNELSFNVTVPRAVVKNVANGSPYIVEIVACSGALCSSKVALRVTPSGQVAPSMPVAAAAGAGATVGTMPPAFGVMPTPTAMPGTQWRVVMRPAQPKVSAQPQTQA